MTEVDLVGVPPGAPGQRLGAASGHGRIGGAQQQPVPGCMRWRQQVLRLLGDQLPDRAFHLIGRRQAGGCGEIAAAGDESRQHDIHHLAPELARDAIADRIDFGTAVPPFEEIPQLVSPRVGNGGTVGQRLQQHVSPLLLQQSPVIELDGEHVLDSRPLRGGEGIPDLLPARPQPVTVRAQMGQHVAIDNPVVGGPDQAGFGIDDARIFVRGEPAVPARAPVSP